MKSQHTADWSQLQQLKLYSSNQAVDLAIPWNKAIRFRHHGEENPAQGATARRLWQHWAERKVSVSQFGSTLHVSSSATKADPKYRRTGVTLEDTGVRDEHGMEPIPSFSSPQKLDAIVEDGDHQDANTATYTADDSMEMAQSR